MSFKKELAKKATDYELLLSFVDSNYEEVSPQQAINKLLEGTSVSTLTKAGEDFLFVTYSIGNLPPINADRLFESTSSGKKSSGLTLSAMLNMEWFIPKEDKEETD